MSLEFSILFAFGAMLCWGLGDFLIQKCVRKIGNIESLAYIGIIGIIILTPLIFMDLKLLNSLSNLLVLLLLGIITFLAAVLDFQALMVGKLSVIEIIFEIELPITIVLAFIFFKETFSLIQILLMILIFLGVILMAVESGYFKKHLKSLEKGVFLGFLSAIGMVFVNFFTAVSSKNVSALMAVWFPWLIFTIICLFYIIYKKTFSKFVDNGIKFRWIVLSMGIFDTLAWLFYALAVSQKELGIVTSITESYPAIALFLGVYFNKERIEWHQYLGALIALSCSFILGFIL